MKKKKMKKDKKRTDRIFAAVLFLSFSATGKLADCYGKLRQTDLKTDFFQLIYYDDHLYAQMGKGIVMDETVSDRQSFLDDFL